MPIIAVNTTGDATAPASTTTITTVGYGEVFPVTGAGRLVGALTMVVGISTFAIVTGKVAEFLVRSSPPEAPAPKDHPIPTADAS